MTVKKKHTSLWYAYNWLKLEERIKSQTDIADKLNVSKGLVSSYINGPTKPSKKFLEDFQNYFDIDLAKFANGMPAPLSPVSKVDEQTFIFSKLLLLESYVAVLLRIACGRNKKKIAEAMDEIDSLRKSIPLSTGVQWKEVHSSIPQ